MRVPGSLGAVDALQLKEADIGVGVALAALVAQVAALNVHCGGQIAISVISERGRILRLWL